MRIRALGTNLYQNFEILTILSYLSPHFYTYNVEIWLKRNDLHVGWEELDFPQRVYISSESLKGLHGLPVVAFVAERDRK